MLLVILGVFDVPFSVEVVIIAKCLHYANSAMNPFLCILLHMPLRRAVRRLMKKKDEEIEGN